MCSMATCTCSKVLSLVSVALKKSIWKSQVGFSRSFETEYIDSEVFYFQLCAY